MSIHNKIKQEQLVKKRINLFTTGALKKQVFQKTKTPEILAARFPPPFGSNVDNAVIYLLGLAGMTEWRMTLFPFQGG